MSEHTQPLLDIIIVNWNAGRQLTDCLYSIMASSNAGGILGRIVVVDNASTDGSDSWLESLPFHVTLVRNSQNRGFGAACNQGAMNSKAEYLLFLNPDALLFESSLQKPIEFMSTLENSTVGIVGIQLIDNNGIARSCTRFPRARDFAYQILGLTKILPQRFHSYFMTEWDHGNSRKVDHVIGAFFLVRRSIFEDLGGFDERFFVYLEDLDFSLRARQKGWVSYYLADVKAYHKGGGTSNQIKATRLFYALRSRILYVYKHFDWWSATAVMLGTIIMEPMARICLSVAEGSPARFTETIKGFAMLWRAMPKLLSQRGGKYVIK